MCDLLIIVFGDDDILIGEGIDGEVNCQDGVPDISILLLYGL